MARRVFLAIYGVSGAAALLYQVVWSRLLTLHLGHTVAAVGTVLAAFMGGLAIGAAVAGRAAARLPRPHALAVYAALEALIGLCALLLPVGLTALLPLLRATYGDGSGAWFPLARVATSLTLIALPAAAMGATLPLAVRWLADRAAGDAGVLYAVNTLGAALGAAVTGFVLLPALGLRLTTLVGVAANAVAAWRLASMPVESDAATVATNVGRGPTPRPAGRSHPTAQARWGPGAVARPTRAKEQVLAPPRGHGWPPPRSARPARWRCSTKSSGRARSRSCSVPPPTRSARCWWPSSSASRAAPRRPAAWPIASHVRSCGLHRR